MKIRMAFMPLAGWFDLGLTPGGRYAYRHTKPGQEALGPNAVVVPVTGERGEFEAGCEVAEWGGTASDGDLLPLAPHEARRVLAAHGYAVAR